MVTKRLPVSGATVSMRCTCVQSELLTSWTGSVRRLQDSNSSPCHRVEASPTIAKESVDENLWWSCIFAYRCENEERLRVVDRPDVLEETKIVLINFLFNARFNNIMDDERRYLNEYALSDVVSAVIGTTVTIISEKGTRI